jgi:hypothetical protein
VATAFKSVQLPKTRARGLALPDFVTIFDALEDVAELERFWSFLDGSRGMLGPVTGVADLFASFRDSNELLVDGAVTPDMISLDPHWGSNWRYRELVGFWTNAPPLFPDHSDTVWSVEPSADGVQRLIARGTPSLS